MAMGTATAKAKAKARAKTKKAKARPRARIVAANERRDSRRAAVRELNGFAKETGARPVSAKTATAKEIEGLVRVLQRRMQTDEQAARLRATVESWVRHGGSFSVPLENAPDPEAPPAPLEQHRLLLRGFRLESKAFTLTFNSLMFILADWVAFRDHVKKLRADCGAAAWAACQERSEEPGPGMAKTLCSPLDPRKQSKP